MSKIRFVGLDVHADTIAVAVAEPDGEVRPLWTAPFFEEAFSGATCAVARQLARTRRTGLPKAVSLGLPVLCPTLLPGGLDSASCRLPQHPAAWKLST